ncbi:Csm2p [Nakaseomyces bracarensis]|uniref:Csm2p n=1 Tax=Nakaseomyces bracarensis TaxID=273131 RepID=UPI0038711F2F
MIGSFDNLNLITLWATSHEYYLAQYIYEFLVTSESDNNEINDGKRLREVYFIDSIDSFPLQQFQRCVDDTTKHVYDHIRINNCLNLSELQEIIKKITETLVLRKIHNKKTKEMEPLEILCIFNGLDVIFRSTTVNKSAESTNQQMREIMLKIRQLCNEYDETPITFKVVLLFNRNDVIGLLPKERISRLQQQKRLKYSSVMEGNSVGDYIGKYYCDDVII